MLVIFMRANIPDYSPDKYIINLLNLNDYLLYII